MIAVHLAFAGALRKEEIPVLTWSNMDPTLLTKIGSPAKVPAIGAELTLEPV